MKIEMLDTQATKRQDPLEFFADSRARVREPFWRREDLRDFDQHSFSGRGDDRSNR